MQKKNYIVLILLFCLSVKLVFSQNQSAVSIFEKLSVIETEYFDIIFPHSSEQTAQFIAAHADDLYVEAADFLNVENLIRIPVVITQKTDVLNAYFTLIPYSRIVLYDTLPSEELSVFSDTILSVFYHELIHAISLKNNIKNRWFIDDVTSTFTAIDMPTSMTEGVAVLAESVGGFGRLNNSYSTHVIRQAKIENKFPHWSDIAGSYSLYTDGSLPYIFGGAFMEYVYRAYGASKLAEFWNASTKIDLLFYDTTFKKVYGLSFSDAWKDFEDSIPTPYVTGQDVPLFGKSLQEYAYKNLTSSDEGLVWQDFYSNSVYFLAHENELGKEKKLFTTDLTSRIHFSNDGRFLSVSGQTGYPSSKNKTSVYDMEEGSFIRHQKDIRDGTVIQLPNNVVYDKQNVFYQQSSVLVGIETQGQISSLVFYDLFSDLSSEPLTSISFDFSTVVFDPVDAGNGTVIALMHKNGEWSFFVYNCITSEQKVFKIPGEMQPSNISSLFVKDSIVYMSLAMNAQSQPVIARVPLNNFFSDSLTLQVQQTQRSGGIFSPVIVSKKINGEETESAVYISRYFEHRELSTMSLYDEDFESIVFHIGVERNLEFDTVHLDTTRYNPLKYFFDGMFIPFIGSVNLSPIDQSIFTGFSLGASVFFVDPAERLLLGTGAGYDIFTNKYSATVTSVFSENNFLLTYDGYFDFLHTGIDKAASKISADVFFPIMSDYNRLGFSNSFRFFYASETDTLLSKGFTLDNAFTVYFSRLRKTNESYYSRLGFVLLNQLYANSYIGTGNSLTDNAMLGSISSIELYIPQLIPIRNPKQWTLNMPVSLSYSKYFGFTANWDVSANAVLFSYELQNAIPYVYLFIQRITLDGGASYMAYDNGAFDVKVTGSLFTTIALNTSLGTGYPVEAGLSFEWDPFESTNEAYTFGLKFALNF